MCLWGGSGLKNTFYNSINDFIILISILSLMIPPISPRKLPHWILRCRAPSSPSANVATPPVERRPLAARAAARCLIYGASDTQDGDNWIFIQARSRPPEAFPGVDVGGCLAGRRGRPRGKSFRARFEAVCSRLGENFCWSKERGLTFWP